MMSRRGEDLHSRRLALAGLAIYAVFLVASPFEHHDLLCHLKTPQHCTSCASSQLGSDPHSLPSKATVRLERVKPLAQKFLGNFSAVFRQLP